MTTTESAIGDIQALRDQLQGEAFAPGEDGWDEARLAWNLAVDQHPAAVVFPESADDIALAVRYARTQGLRVNAQGTGHNAAANGDMAGTLLLRTSRMRQVEINAAERIARVEAGALWSDVTDPASELGLATLAGSARDVGVVGYVLGGGLSFLARKHGLASNSVRAIELVTADGELIRADAEHHAELFWALRGGGGNFGVVTAVEIELLETGAIYAGLLAYDWEHAREAFEAWYRLIREVGDDTTTVAKIMQFPPMDEIPEPFRSRKLAIIEIFHLGEPADLENKLAPLRALEPEMDTMEMLPPAALAYIHMDPPEPVPATSGHRQLNDVGEKVLDAMLETAGPDSGSNLLMVEFRQLGGALRQAKPDHGALDKFDADLLLFAASIAATPEMKAAADEEIGRVIDAFAFADAGSAYLNFVEQEADSATFYDPGTYARLRGIKARYDARDLIRGNHQIPPAE